MYSGREYRSDLKRAWKPVGKSIAVFGKSLSLRDPFNSFMPCCLMVVRLVWFFFQLAFFTVRKLRNP